MQGFSSIDGISSGLNTTAIIDAIIQFERRPAVVLDAHRINKTNIISSFKAIQAKLIALNVNVASLTRSSTFTKATVNVSDSDFLTATASGKVATGAYDIEVMALARNHQLASQGFKDIDETTIGTGTISISLGSGTAETITIDSTNNTLMTLKQSINDKKLGITASIVNDGSSSNSFRLLLTSDKTGLSQNIGITTSLTGGTAPNFATSSFDVPEFLTSAATTTSTLSLGSTASFSGSTNKVYTFTVSGSGSQTIGTDNVTIDWTDGTDSGSILVTQADTEVALVGTGSEGLKISVGAGILTAGDTFQVQTFAPTLQNAADAKIGFGSSSSGGSPIVITSDTNTFDDVIAGISLSVQKVSLPGQTVNVTADIDVDGIRGEFESFVSSYNDVMDFIDKQNTYDLSSETGGILLGDLTLQRAQNQIRRALGSAVTGLSKEFNQIFAVGLRTNPDGKLILRDQSKFNAAIRDNVEEVIKMFTESGTSSSAKVEYLSQTSDTKAGEDYKVDITQAATNGRFQGAEMENPTLTPLTLTSSNNKLKFKLSGRVSEEMTLTAKTYTSGTELAAEVQKQIDADKNIGDKGLTVVWVDTDIPNSMGHLLFTTSDFGSKAQLTQETSIANSAFAAIGIATGQVFAGKDVEGTINGEKATGIGQILTGDDDNKTTDGLKLKVTLSSTEFKGEEEATVSVLKGIAARLRDLVDTISRDGDGLLDSRIKGENKQVANLVDRIADIDANMERRRERLQQQFLDMEAAIGAFGAQSQFLAIQLANLNNNFRPPGQNN